MAGLFQFGSISCCCDESPCIPKSDGFHPSEDISDSILEWEVSGTAEKVRYFNDNALYLNGSIKTTVDNDNINGRVIGISFGGLNSQHIKVQFTESFAIELTINTDCNLVFSKDGEILGVKDIPSMTEEDSFYSFSIYMKKTEVVVVLNIRGSRSENIEYNAYHEIPIHSPLFRSNYEYPEEFSLTISSDTGIYIQSVSINGLYDEEEFNSCPKVPFSEPGCSYFSDEFSREDSSDLGCNWDSGGFSISNNTAIGSGFARYIGKHNVPPRSGVRLDASIKGNQFYLQINQYRLEYTYLGITGVSSNKHRFGVKISGGGEDVYNITYLTKDHNGFYTLQFTCTPSVIHTPSKNTVVRSYTEENYDCYVHGQISHSYEGDDSQSENNMHCAMYVNMWQVYDTNAVIFLDIPYDVNYYTTLGFGSNSLIEVDRFAINQLNCLCGGISDIRWNTSVTELNPYNVETNGNVQFGGVLYQPNQPLNIGEGNTSITFGPGTSSIRIKKPCNTDNWCILVSIPDDGSRWEAAFIERSFSLTYGNNITKVLHAPNQECNEYGIYRGYQVYFNDKWIYYDNSSSYNVPHHGLEMRMWGNYAWSSDVPFFLNNGGGHDDYFTITANGIYEQATITVSIISMRHYTEFSNATEIEEMCNTPGCALPIIFTSNGLLRRLFQRGILQNCKPYTNLLSHMTNCEQGIQSWFYGGIERQLPDKVYLTINNMVNTPSGGPYIGQQTLPPGVDPCDGCNTLNGTYELHYAYYLGQYGYEQYIYYDETTICTNGDCGFIISLPIPNYFGWLYNGDYINVPPQGEDMYRETYNRVYGRLSFTITSMYRGYNLFHKMDSDIQQVGQISTYGQDWGELYYCPLYDNPHVPVKNVSFKPRYLQDPLSDGKQYYGLDYLLCSGGSATLSVPVI